MSNKYPIFFGLILCLCAGPHLLPAQQGAQRWAEAEILFGEGKIQEAQIIYRELEAAGWETEALWYRQAFLCEEEGDLPGAVYYLRKLQAAYGGKEIDARLLQLQERIRGRGEAFAFAPGAYYLFWRQHSGKILIALTLLLLVGWVIWFSSWRNPAAAALSMGVLLGGLLWLHAHYLLPAQAVVLHPTSCYSLAGYAAPRVNIDLMPGDLVTIQGRHDLWCRISAAGKRAWVPEFVLKEL